MDKFYSLLTLQRSKPDRPNYIYQTSHPFMFHFHNTLLPLLFPLHFTYHFTSKHTAFEYLDDAAMTVSNKNLKTRNPLSTNAPFYVLIESHGSNAEHDQVDREKTCVGLEFVDVVV